jgi:hypothetical protein
MTNSIKTTASAFTKLQTILEQVDELYSFDCLDEESKKIMAFAKAYLLHLNTRISTISQIDFLKESLNNQVCPIDKNIEQLYTPDSPTQATDHRKRNVIETNLEAYDTQKVEKRRYSSSVYDTEPKYLSPRDLMKIDVKRISTKYIFVHRKFVLSSKVIKETPVEFKDSVYTKNGIKIFFIRTSDKGIRPYKFHAYYVGQNGFLYMYLKEIDHLVPAIYGNNFHTWK